MNKFLILCSFVLMIFISGCNGGSDSGSVIPPKPEPTPEPIPQPSPQPTPEPTPEPSPQPTPEPTDIPESLVSEYLMIERTKSNQGFKWTSEKTIIVDNLKGFVDGIETEYSPYGGVLSTQYPATGYIYTLKVKDRWWFVDPDGHLMMHKGINSLKNAGQDGFSPYKNLAEFNAGMIKFVKDLGFNGGGGWSGGGSMNGGDEKMVHIDHLNLIKDFHTQVYGTFENKGLENGVMPVFHSEWPNHINAEIAKVAALHNGDPYFLGIFCGNEQTFNFDALTRFLQLDTTDEGHIYALNWLREHKNDPTATIDEVTEADEAAFFGVYVEAYYKPIYETSKKLMPNHLYLGSRQFQMALLTHETFMSVYGKYADVLSLNRYTNWTEPAELMNNIQKWTNKPFIATEFYAKGMTADYHTNVPGAGQIVKTQTERGYFYQNLVLSWMNNRSCIGWHWFAYRDGDHTTGAEISNKGIVDLWHTPYTEMTDLMKQLNTQDFRLIEFLDNTTY